MTVEQFIEWVRNEPYYKGWNIHYNWDIATNGMSSHTFLATSGDKCHRYTRATITILVQGIKDNLNHIEREAQNASKV